MTDLQPVTSPLLTTPHGFFTRQGGISEGVYASLNVALGSQDNPQHITENRRRVAASFGQPVEKLCTLSQIHGKRCVILDSPPAATIQADACVTTAPELMIGILTADCVPVLFYDPSARVIGAAHAGWKGALAGIIQETITCMTQCGTDPSNIIAVQGASIAQSSYEVGADFHAQFLDADAANAAFFIPSPDRPQTHYCYDNVAYVRATLMACDIQRYDHIAHDTYHRESHYFSYRRATHRNEPDYGRQISAIMLSAN